MGAYGLQGFFWSDNSRYFYYTKARQGVPDGCGFWERPYLVFDTQTLQTQWLGGGPLSPDKTPLATWHYTPLGVTNSTVSILIWDLNRGESARHIVDNDLIEGPIAWAPDGNALVFLETENYCPPGGVFLTRLDAPNFQPTLEEKLTQEFDNLRWDTPTELRLFTFQRGREWRYVFADKKLKEVPRTPTSTETPQK